MFVQILYFIGSHNYTEVSKDNNQWVVPTMYSVLVYSGASGLLL